MQIEYVDKLKASEAKEYLKKLIAALDELDEDDYFGTEGWRHRFEPRLMEEN